MEMKEMDLMTATGARLHYAQAGDKTNPPMLLIHGQGVCWKDYESVISELSNRYMLYIPDCFGHGDSEKNPELYRCNVIGDAMAELIQRVIGKPCIVSGHSSGGILAAYAAGRVPQLVRGVLLEDPPFFCVQPGEFEATFAYRDGFQVTHQFLNQHAEKEYLVYYLENGYIYNYLGQRFAGKDFAHKLAEEAREKLKADPDTLPSLAKVPAKSFHSFAYWKSFDLQFSEAFYTGEWFNGVKQEEILKSVQCPTLYLKAKTKYGKDGVLWAANTEEAANRVTELLKNGRRKTVRSGHDIHYEKPRKFLKAVRILEKMI